MRSSAPVHLLLLLLARVSRTFYLCSPLLHSSAPRARRRRSKSKCFLELEMLCSLSSSFFSFFLSFFLSFVGSRSCECESGWFVSRRRDHQWKYVHRFIWTIKHFFLQQDQVIRLLLVKMAIIFLKYNNITQFDTKLNCQCSIKTVVLLLKMFSQIYAAFLPKLWAETLKKLSSKIQISFSSLPPLPPPPNYKVRRGLRFESCRFIVASRVQVRVEARSRGWSCSPLRRNSSGRNRHERGSERGPADRIESRGNLG